MDRALQIERELMSEHGRLIDIDTLALMMGYPSKKALQMVDYRGAMPFQLIKIPGRRSKVAPVRIVAQWLARIEKKGGLNV